MLYDTSGAILSFDVGCTGSPVIFTLQLSKHTNTRKIRTFKFQ